MPGFSDENIAWIPYSKGTFLTYSDGENTINFEVVDFYKTKPTSHGGLVMDYECEDEGYYLTNKVSDYIIQETYSYGWNWHDRGMKIKITDGDVFLFDILGTSIEKRTQETDSLEIK